MVVVDQRMHEMDGTTFIQEARNIWPWLGFVIITGYAGDLPFDLMTRMGVRRILEKPVRPADLFQAVWDEYQARLTARKGLDSSMEQQRQLRMLGHLGETALAAGTFLDALREMADGLGGLMSCDVAGLLGFLEGQNIIVLSIQTKVSTDYLDAVRDELLTRYKILSGKSLDPSSLRVEIEGGRGGGGAGWRFPIMWSPFRFWPAARSRECWYSLTPTRAC